MSLLPSISLHHQFNIASTISFAPTSSTISFAPTFLGLHIVHHRSPSRLNSTFCVNSTISLAPTISFSATFIGLPIHHRSQPCLSAPLSMSLLPLVPLQLPRSSYPPLVSIPFQRNFQCQFHRQFNVAFTISFDSSLPSLSPWMLPPIRSPLPANFSSCSFGRTVGLRSAFILQSPFGFHPATTQPLLTHHGAADSSRSGNER